LGSQDALGAGGRYNDLVSQLGGPQADAMGFALGVERIILAMPKDETQIPQGLDFYFIPLEPAALKKSFQIVNLLRGQGLAGDMGYKLSSLKSQMRVADKAGARFVVLIGADELAQGYLTVKDMKAGQQEKIEMKDDGFEQLQKFLLERCR